MSHWHQEIRESRFHDRPPEGWFVVGWHEDEHAMYHDAQEKWETRQRDGWVEQSRPENILDVTDDYFRWNVITPWWYLHRDRAWRKAMDGLFGAARPHSGIYRRREDAAVALAAAQPPRRFERYRDHLDQADPPISCRDDQSTPEETNRSVV